MHSLQALGFGLQALHGGRLELFGAGTRALKTS